MLDRGRPPPRVSWRRLLNTDVAGLTVLGLLFGTLIALVVLILLVTHYTHG
jgi:hypothetical protein